MNIAVLVKQVPDTAARIQLVSDHSDIEQRDLNWVLSPYDEFAVEEALALVEKHGGEVTAVAIGDDNQVACLRTALAMGANHALHIKRDGAADQLASARAIADTLRDRNVDLIFAGWKTTDDDSSALGAMVATLLEMPCVTEVHTLEIDGTAVKAERNIEGGSEVFEASLPCVITTQKGLNEPRYPKLKGIMMAKKKPIETVDAGAADTKTQSVTLAYPPERPAGKIVGEGVEAVPELVKLLRDEAKVID